MPNSSPETLKYMLKRIGIDDPLELFDDIPKEIILDEQSLDLLGRPLAEWEVKKLVESKLSKNKIYPQNRIFRPPCPHITPSLVKHIMGRSEFYTSYTPYQPEISQGLLQVFFEYQSMIADLFDLDVVNASHYDGATALAESILMGFRVKRNYNVIMDEYLDPLYKAVIETYLSGIGGRVEYIRNLEEEHLKEKLEKGDTAVVVVDNPTFMGRIRENIEDLVDIIHDYGALVVSLVNPLSLGVIKPPGEYNADIAVGEGRSLGLGLNYGGYGLGIIAAKWDSKLVRQMPGRIIGLGEDVDGNPAYLMILQTREQHIRRERATSNITTNEALTTIGAAVFMALLGRNGFIELGEAILRRTAYLRMLFSRLGNFSVDGNGYYFGRIPIRFSVLYENVEKKLLEKGFLPGLDLSKYWSELKNTALFCVSEIHSKRSIEELVKSLEEVA
jgi:glycine dehydrogenase subunit 1